MTNALFPRLALVAAALLAALSGLSAQVPYSRLETKANRFFDQKEWAQAAATYYQMIERRPEVAATYGKAIVVNAVRGDTVAEMDLMVKALNAKIPFDSVLSCVRTTSFSLGKSNLYGDFLLRVKDAYPWMRRPMDNYLLRYYVYRNDGEKMMEYSRMMLQGAPHNIGFLKSFANGAMLCGEYAEGVAAYRQILAISPDDYDSLLALGNYYYLENRESPSSADAEEAIKCLTRANALHPTPYVESMLRELLPPVRK